MTMTGDVYASCTNVTHGRVKFIIVMELFVHSQHIYPGYVITCLL